MGGKTTSSPLLQPGRQIGLGQSGGKKKKFQNPLCSICLALLSLLLRLASPVENMRGNF